MFEAIYLGIFVGFKNFVIIVWSSLNSKTENPRFFR